MEKVTLWNVSVMDWNVMSLDRRHDCVQSLSLTQRDTVDNKQKKSLQNNYSVITARRSVEDIIFY